MEEIQPQRCYPFRFFSIFATIYTLYNPFGKATVTMKRFISCIIMLLVVCSICKAQKISVESFESVPSDLYASTHRRNDLNGTPCALIKVQLARPGAIFTGNIAGDVNYDHGEYYVYMMKGSKFLQVKLDGYIPLDLVFANYGYTAVESLTTYRLVLMLPMVAGQSVDDGKSYFALEVTPKNASVVIDGETGTLAADGTLIVRLPRGTHTFQVTSGGYEPYQETFTLGVEKKEVKVNLVSTKATLTVKCATSGADIYINERKQGGNSSWTGTLDPGSYVVEARKEGYYSQQQSVDLGAKQNRTVELPALIARVGQLDVAYRPLSSEVWIDGAKVGTSPDVFKNLTVGSHRVEIRKEGYQSEMKTVTIVEGQTASLSGSLAAMTSSTSTTIASSATGTTTSSSSSQAKQTFTVNGVSFTMVRVEGGSFTMGATDEQVSEAWYDEKPSHQVTLSTYSIGETEVTQELWQAVMGSNPSNFKGAKLPVEEVSWNDCKKFIKKLNKKTGKTFRLPTEAEWEYASRGGSKSKGYKYSGSNDIESVAWYTSNSGSKTHDVATKQSNELGLYDMSGNVSLACALSSPSNNLSSFERSS